MLRRPDSYASHKQYAQNSYHNALDNDDTRIFMALSTAQNDLGTILGSVLLEYCRIADPMFVFELPDFERLGVKEDLFVYGQIEAHKKRREVMESDYYSTFHRDGVMSQRAPLIAQTRLADWRTLEYFSHCSARCQPHPSQTNRNVHVTGFTCS